MARSSSFGQLAGLLILSVIVLVTVNLFGMWSTHRHGLEALAKAEAVLTLTDQAQEAQIEFKAQVQLWKNLLLRGQKAEEFQSYKDRLQRQQDEVTKDLDTLLQSPSLPVELKEEVASIRQAHDDLEKSYLNAAANYVVGDPGSIFRVDASVRGIDQKINDRLDAIATKLAATRKDNLAQLTKKSEEQYEVLRWVDIVACALAAIATIAVTLSARRAIG